MRPLAPVAAFGVAVLGILLFSVMDALVKGVSLWIGAYNAILWRGFAGVAISGIPYALRRPRLPKGAALRFHSVRGILSAAVAFLFFWGLARVPLAQGIALSFVAPIIALILAALLLKETISRSTILATLLGFAGVLTIIGAQAHADLGDGAFWGALAILASAVGYAWNIILMRQQAQVAGPVEIAFFQSLFMTAGLLVAAPFLLKVPDIVHVPAIVGAAALATGSLLLLSWAYAHAEANFLAPVEFTAFIWAAVLGWLLFGEKVSLLTIAGAAMIVIGCLLTARQKRTPLPHVETTAV